MTEHASGTKAPTLRYPVTQPADRLQLRERGGKLGSACAIRSLNVLSAWPTTAHFASGLAIAGFRIKRQAPVSAYMASTSHERPRFRRPPLLRMVRGKRFVARHGVPRAIRDAISR